MHVRRIAILALFCLPLVLPAQTIPAQTTDAPATDAPAVAPTETDRTRESVAKNTHDAWDILTTAMADTKHPDTRIQALAALGTIGTSSRAEKLITEAMHDPDVDVRTAAVLAVGESNDRNLFTPLRNALDDKEPQVAFAAATTLWKHNDRSGEDILVAVVNGERRATAGIKDSALHTAAKDLHNPATLARIGALQGASMLLGPFGFGITAYEYMHKNGADTSRVTAIEQIAQQRTNPIRKTLMAALTDKDPAVRAAACKALATYHEKPVSDAILHLFDDPKTPVRLTAAASYLRAISSTPHA